MRKIMHSRDVAGNIFQYIPARITEGKEWYISFYAWDPFLNRLRRKRVKVNRIASVRERRSYARMLCEQINTKLRQNWSPFIEAVAAKGNEFLSKAMDNFIKRKSAELRPDSMRSYQSHCNRLMDFCKRQDKAEIRAATFTVAMARQYLDEVLDRGNSARTYNNTLTFCRVIFNWLQAFEYCAMNPFGKLKMLREQEKIRKLIPRSWREKINLHLRANDPGFLLACMLQYYAEIRPSEQTKLILGNISLSNQVITVPPQASKNGRLRFATIPDQLMEYLLEIPWTDLSMDRPILGVDFQYGAPQMKDARDYTRRWQRLRKALKMPMQYQFYSLRDGGIVHMIESGVPLNNVMAQAGHADLHTTSKYTRHINPKAVEQIKGLKKGF